MLLLDELKKFGLTEGEAKAYKALIGLKEARASDIAKLSKVPRSKIYFIMDSLHHKGFAEIIPEKVMMFRAIPFEKVLHNFIEERQKKINEISKTGEKIASQLKNVQIESQENGGFTIFRGRKIIYRKINETLEKAKQSIFICVDADDLRNLHSVPRSRKNRIEIVTNISPKDRILIKKLSKFANIRHYSKLPPTKIIIVDRKETILFHLNSPMALYSNDTNFAEMTMTLALNLLKMSMPATEKISEIETGKVAEEIKIIRQNESEMFNPEKSIFTLPPREEVCVISTELSMMRAAKTRRVDNALTQTKEGLKFRCICPITKNNIELIRKASELAEIRHIDNSPMRLIIVDEKECLLQHTITGEGEEPWIFSRASEFVSSMKIFFDKMWTNAVPAKERIAQLEVEMERESLRRFI